MAMLASEAFGGGPAPVSILATDISDRALARAAEARYSERSMRDVSDAQRERFFLADEGRSTVRSELRSMVRLRKHNLVADEAPPAGEARFDLILCRNVLIYFGAKRVESTVALLGVGAVPGWAADPRRLRPPDELGTEARRDRRRPARAGQGRRSGQGMAPQASPAASESRPSRRRTPGVADALEAANRKDYARAVELVEHDPGRGPARRGGVLRAGDHGDGPARAGTSAIDSLPPRSVHRPDLRPGRVPARPARTSCAATSGRRGVPTRRRCAPSRRRAIAIQACSPESTSPN